MSHGQTLPPGVLTITGDVSSAVHWIELSRYIALETEVRDLRAALERLTSAAAGHGMVSEMDGLSEIAVLVMGLHARAEKAEDELAASRENHIDANRRNMAANERADKAEAALERETKRAENAQALYGDEVRLRENYGRQLVTLAAALERARALVPLLRGMIEWLQAEQGFEEEGTMAWRSWQDQIAEVENAIAALAEGGRPQS